MVSAFSGTAAAQQRPLVDLSLEELANLEITSVSRRPEPLSEAAASIFVITGEDIRRSGARTLPEALRLAPNLIVARINATQYAISARGFNNAIGNKLLVLIDGRTVYSPLFSGVFWDQQEVMLEDVARIEVISGPGATLWGANAVNGVINVITRPARETQGGLVSLGGGNFDRGAALRYGEALADGGAYRLYAKTRTVENTRTTAGAAVPDAAEFSQVGFRADWSEFTLQGDAYRGASEDRGTVLIFPLGQVEVSGLNLLGRWTRRLEGGGELRVQGYYDQAKRIEAVLFQPDTEIYDLEFQHALAPRGRHRLLWGGGYRHGRDFVPDGILGALRPQRRELEWANLYVQDEIRLSDPLTLTGGIKLEHNDYTGMEHLPSVRLAWTPAPGRFLWSAWSRAVRAPARIDRDVIDPLFGSILGGPNFVSEVADVLEAGLRASGARYSYSLTAYWHEWDRLRSGSVPPGQVENRIEGPVYGIETWGSWRASRAWTLSAGLLTLRKELRAEPGTTGEVGVDSPTLAKDPEFQWQLRSSLELGGGHYFDAALRRVDDLPAPVVPAYTALDLRYAWRSRELELAAGVENALGTDHPEFRTSAAAPSEIERTVFLSARWTM